VLSASLLVALLAAFLAGCVSGLTGFGFALISVPLLLFVYDPTTVVVLTAVLSTFINVVVVWDSWRDIDRGIVLALLFPALVGVVVGVEVLRVVDPEYIRLGVGFLVVVSALLLLRDVELPGARSRWGSIVAGSASGALSTSPALAGPPIVLLLASRGFPKRVFRGSSALYFLFLGLAGLVVLLFRGLVDGGHLPLALVLVPVALLGKIFGTAFLRRVSERAFRWISLGVVILTGALGVVIALWALL
jgi:uncharacterized membrane protein YfcA